ncbi:MAG: RNA-binding transcriptional accessory protein [Bdellovibrionales bacterium]|nr:RNA-binding transcriptional accessory protein [Bdellovibrionales bacterium]
MNFNSWFSQHEPSVSNKSGGRISARSIETVLNLKAEGATLPFIARYRKEQTGNLDEVQIQAIIDRKEEFDELISRQAYIVGEIEKQGKLTDELKSKVMGTFDKNLLEDLYLPYKQKRKSKATLAKEAGLEPLAEWIWAVAHGEETPEDGQTLELWAFTFKNEEKGFKDAESAIAGATDILIERLSENLDLRQYVRDSYAKRGHMKTAKAEKAKPASKYTNYFEYEEKLSSLLDPRNSHRYLALRRGWIEEELSISFGGSKSEPGFEDDLTTHFHRFAGADRDSIVKPVMEKAARVAVKAHVIPSIENEFHKNLKDVADQMAIQVFSENVRKILLAAPYGPKAVLGVDPGVRTGCKLAIIDGSGKFLADSVMKLQTDSEKEQGKIFIQALGESGSVTAIVVGNGTAGRETEAFIRAALKEKNLSLPVIMVSESGASVYSASPVAREEFPNLDVTVRGAISIARRFQDPLAELVKIDPKSIGVGQYQHDVSQTALKRALDYVVDSCVNAVGVNLNTGSIHLLSHVSGIGEGLAKAIVEHREQSGLFKSREDLLNVPRFSKKTYELAAGFLRIPESSNPLDNTGVHPEKYADLEAIAKSQGKSVADLIGTGAKQLLKTPEAKEKLGEFTVKDIVGELEKPGRDPRDVFVPVKFREDLNELKDVEAGMICPGVITNVTNFGAFVDIGVHQDGLVHISQLTNKFVTDPNQVVSPGDKVTVKVLEVNLEKSQMALTMRFDEKTAGRGGGKAAGPAKTLVVSYGEDKPRTPGPTIAPRSPRPSHGVGRSSKPMKPKEAFNNPFGGLATLKDTLKK